MVAKKHLPLVEKIKESLSTNIKARQKAIMILYDAQTLEEQSTQTTKQHNNVGFGAVDAEIGTKLARKLVTNQSWSRLDDWHAKRITLKYARTQLLKIAISKTTC